MSPEELQSLVENCIKESLADERERMTEFTSGIMGALKAIGGTMATYSLMKGLIQQILTDKKFILLFSQKIGDRLDYDMKKRQDRYMDPRYPLVTKGTGLLNMPIYLGKGQRVRNTLSTTG